MLATAGACADSTPTGATNADVVGVISEVRSSPSRQVIVRDMPGGQERVLLISASTIIDHRDAGRLSGSSLETLAPGLHIQAWHTGVEYRTDPPQYDAIRIVVLP